MLCLSSSASLRTSLRCMPSNEECVRRASLRHLLLSIQPHTAIVKAYENKAMHVNVGHFVTRLLLLFTAFHFNSYDRLVLARSA